MTYEAERRPFYVQRKGEGAVLFGGVVVLKYNAF